MNSVRVQYFCSRLKPNPWKVWITTGTPADFTARATFAKNFFAAGGIEGTGDDGFAIWPAPGAQAYVPGLNVITHCTAQTAFLANGGAIYGGDSMTRRKGAGLVRADDSTPPCGAF